MKVLAAARQHHQVSDGLSEVLIPCFPPGTPHPLSPISYPDSGCFKCRLLSHLLHFVVSAFFVWNRLKIMSL